MFGAELLLVLALAVFTAALARARPRSPSRSGAEVRSRLVDHQTVRALALFGAGGLVLLAVAVFTVGLVGRSDQAEGLAVIGLFGYGAYLTLMVLLSGWLARH